MSQSKHAHYQRQVNKEAHWKAHPGKIVVSFMLKIRNEIGFFCYKGMESAFGFKLG